MGFIEGTVQVSSMVKVWKLAIILAGCSLLLPIIGVIVYFLEFPETINHTVNRKVLFILCATYTLPPILLLGLLLKNCSRSKFPLSEAFLWLSFAVASLSPALFPFFAITRNSYSYGEFSVLRGYSSLWAPWYGEEPPGFFLLLLQAGGIALIAVTLRVSRFLERRADQEE
jgi:hypothetical protein